MRRRTTSTTPVLSMILKAPLLLSTKRFISSTSTFPVNKPLRSQTHSQAVLTLPHSPLLSARSVLVSVTISVSPRWQ
ncbi:hypothetical protein I314_02000 [Cryptococcus bacillisporus CA1873]|uniref:Uncharacterized protein n=1 Tax=Cryptococcus bacillisporus CA1873 TaxID=1296111 RepID=A0ABR5BFH8_CRYGA|nr:hypothetical protein I314_02000 [Cryptococcus bacillisporus CA1873]|eukprot:KIR67583.1 hypothetical protein I314_02000 [Cryptococcus gattii CA1873]